MMVISKRKFGGKLKKYAQKQSSEEINRLYDFSVLIIDDEQTPGEAMVDVLRNMGYSSKHVFTIDNALEELETKKYFCVVTDVWMPDKEKKYQIQNASLDSPDGLGGIIAQHLVVKYFQLPVLLYSGNPQVKGGMQTLKSLDDRIVNTFTKPFDSENLPDLEDSLRICRGFNQNVLERVKLQQQLAQAQKQAQVGKFAAGLGHYLRNLLTTVVGCDGLTQNILSDARKYALQSTQMKQANKLMSALLTTYASLEKDATQFKTYHAKILRQLPSLGCATALKQTDDEINEHLESFQTKLVELLSLHNDFQRSITSLSSQHDT